MGDLIDRQTLLGQLRTIRSLINSDADAQHFIDVLVMFIEHLPSAQPEIKPIEYRDCANAMLRMWIDNVLTDGEYNRIMDKLNKYWGKVNA